MRRFTFALLLLSSKMFSLWNRNNTAVWQQSMYLGAYKISLLSEDIFPILGKLFTRHTGIYINIY